VDRSWLEPRARHRARQRTSDPARAERQVFKVVNEPSRPWAVFHPLWKQSPDPGYADVSGRFHSLQVACPSGTPPPCKRPSGEACFGGRALAEVSNLLLTRTSAARPSRPCWAWAARPGRGA